MNTKTQTPIQPDWWMKSIFGLLLSLILAIGLSNLFIVLCRNFFEQDTLVQVGMWGIALLWLPLFFSSFYFKRAWHMILTMLIGIVFIYSLMFWLRG
jgi:hypothetical protein